MNGELDVLLMVAQRLEKAKIVYMISGSMALNYYALPRRFRDTLMCPHRFKNAVLLWKIPGRARRGGGRENQGQVKPLAQRTVPSGCVQFACGFNHGLE